MRLNTAGIFLSGFLLLFSLTGCGGGGGGASSTTSLCVEDPLKTYTLEQIAAFDGQTIATLRDIEIVALGQSIKLLTNAALGGLNDGVSNIKIFCKPHVSQINAITAEQVKVLTPSQIRLIGSTGAGGGTFTSKIDSLNDGAWAALVGDAAQVAAMTAAEVGTFSSPRITAFGANIQYLSTSALSALSDKYVTTTVNRTGQIQSISAAQVNVLTPAQVRVLGSSENGISKIGSLNDGAWQALIDSDTQIAAITGKEIESLSTNRFMSFGVRLNKLSDEAIGATKTTYIATTESTTSQMNAITAQQIVGFTPSQISVLAGSSGSKLKSLNASAFSALTDLQKGGLTASQRLGCGC